jgi:putative membrane protein
MRKSLLAAAAGALLMVTPAFAANSTNPASPAASMLNQANQMNKEEISGANMLSNKAGNDVALKTLATTLKYDHQANETAVKDLASRENVTLQSYRGQPAQMKNLSNLHGTAFDKAFLSREAQDHRQALQQFEAARNEPQSQAMKMYIDETIPVLKAHLAIIENVQRDMGFASGAENTAANTQ